MNGVNETEVDSSDCSCSDCGLLNCYRSRKTFPSFCLTESLDPQQRAASVSSYLGDGIDARLSRAAADVEEQYHGKLTRVDEIIAFAHRLGAIHIGIASCLALMQEARIFAEILHAKGLKPYCVVCKVGSVDKTEVGLAEKAKLNPGSHEAICNPVLQARLLNAHKTDLNVMVGLCVGHDSLFIRHSEAPVTTLIVKDRLLKHNPAAALHA